ncbi:MAG: hypothetical protein H6672_14965 [Anaerolineaceae bacterium]|nr:hypothetical protein [Anaerolineaceae bacterium]
MLRFLISLLIGLAVGAGVGLYLGWVQAPLEFVDSPASSLSPRYQDEYIVMVSGGYLADGDLGGALSRLQILGAPNIPQLVQDTAEKYISDSRGVDDIRKLVALAEAMGRLTPIMEPYRRLTVPGGGS